MSAHHQHHQQQQHHVSIQEPSTEEIKEIESTQTNFEDSPTGILCSICNKEESHYVCYPCRCCTFCKKCAMRVATGGRCKKCHNMFTSITQLHTSTTSDNGEEEMTAVPEGGKDEEES